MVLGSAGIFGGNERATSSFAPVRAVRGAETQSTGSSDFSPLLSEALNGSKVPSRTPINAGSRVARAVITPNLAPNRATIGRISSADDTNPSVAITLLPGLPPVSPSTGTTGAGTSSTTPTTTTTTTGTSTGTGATAAPTGTTDPTVALLEAALAASGVDTSQLQFNEHRDLETYPGGSYINDIITVQDGGKTANYMTNLVAAAPQVTVTLIQEMMAGTNLSTVTMGGG